MSAGGGSLFETKAQEMAVILAIHVFITPVIGQNVVGNRHEFWN